MDKITVDKQIVIDFIERNGITQKEFARIIGIGASPSNINNWIKGRERTPAWMPTMLESLKYYMEVNDMSLLAVKGEIQLRTPYNEDKIREYLIRFQKRYKLKQSELAVLLGVSKSCIKHWEYGGVQKIPGWVKVLLFLLNERKYVSHWKKKYIYDRQ
jgi:DNA-binding transcriptional regulator YiaG